MHMTHSKHIMVRQEKTCSFDITKVKRKSDARNEKVNRAITCLGREDHIIFNDTPINLVQKGGGCRLEAGGDN